MVRKKGMDFYIVFNSYEIETKDRGEIPFSSQIVPRGLLDAEEL